MLSPSPPFSNTRAKFSQAASEVQPLARLAVAQ